jgi:hypothetical protein
VRVGGHGGVLLVEECGPAGGGRAVGGGQALRDGRGRPYAAEGCCAAGAPAGFDYGQPAAGVVRGACVGGAAGGVRAKRPSGAAAVAGWGRQAIASQWVGLTSQTLPMSISGSANRSPSLLVLRRSPRKCPDWEWDADRVYRRGVVELRLRRPNVLRADQPSAVVYISDLSRALGAADRHTAPVWASYRVIRPSPGSPEPTAKVSPSGENSPGTSNRSGTCPVHA